MRAEKVLVAEDEAQNIALMRRMLQKMGYADITVVTDGLQVLEILGTERFGILIMDISMPNLNGIEASRLIRNSTDASIRQLPIILVSGNTPDYLSNICKAEKIDAYLPKPYRYSELEKAISNVLNNKNITKPMCHKKKKVLIIDDEVDIANLLKRLFEKNGMEAHTAHNGDEGLRIAKEQEFDLVVTDIIMPEKEGVEVIFELQRECPSCKIIAVSGGGFLNPDEYLSTAKEIGVAATFSKPFDTKKLIETALELVSNCTASAAV
jgi:CheY-like chemotaxis protein